ncbi:MAG TPA: hypothetical protein PKY05_15670 [Fibrobacteria bacterium]|nr:hypothetical protein [Fibrobacteria bacterium]
MMIPIALGAAAIANRERIWNLIAAKGITNWDRQQAVLAKRPIFPTLESIQKGYPTQESIEYREEDDGKPIIHLNLDCREKKTEVEEGAWGVTKCHGNLDFPPEFTAKAEAFQVRVDGSSCRTFGRVNSCEFALGLNVYCIPFSDKRWLTWDDWMDARVGRGKLSLPERVYWSYMHEMDHFQVYHEFWRFIAGRIFMLTNSLYPSVAHAEREIENFKKNVAFNFFKARRKSSVFDQVKRGLPQAGGRYGSFEYTKSETFFWQNQGEWTSDAFTKSDKEYQSQMKNISRFDALATWLPKQMEKPGGLEELKAMVESKKTATPGAWK